MQLLISACTTEADLSIPFQLHNFRSMGQHCCRALWGDSDRGGSGNEKTRNHFVN